MPVPSQWTFPSVKCLTQHLKKWLTIKFWLICIDQVVTLAKTNTYDMPKWGNQVEYLAGNRSDINFSQPNIDEFVLTNMFANIGKKDQDAVTVTETMFTIYRIAFHGAIPYSMNSPAPGGTSRSHIEHRAGAVGRARGFVALNPSPYSWISTSIPAGSRPRSKLFISATGGIGVHTEQKYGTKPIRYLMLHFEIDTAQLRSIKEIAPTQPFMCVNRRPIRYDFWGGALPHKLFTKRYYFDKQTTDQLDLHKQEKTYDRTFEKKHGLTWKRTMPKPQCKNERTSD